MGNTFFQRETHGARMRPMDAARLLTELDQEPISDLPPDFRFAIDDCLEPTPWLTLVRDAIAHGLITVDDPHLLCEDARRRVLNQRFDAAIRNRSVRIVERLFDDHKTIGITMVFQRFADLIKNDPDLWTMFFRHRRTIKDRTAREQIQGPTFTFIVALYIFEIVGVPYDQTANAFVRVSRMCGRG